MQNKKETRRSFFQKSVASSIGLMVSPYLLKGEIADNAAYSNLTPVEPIWRNKQEGMHYRMLGRTGMMVSELGMGTFPYTSDEVYPLFDAAIEKGINYFDTAFAYSKGQVETNLGNYFKLRECREKIFLTTKLSGYNKAGYLKKIFDGLPQNKQEDLQLQADELLKERMVLRPGYHFNFFQGQEDQLKSAYLWHIVLKEFGLKEEWKKEIKTNAHSLLEGSLQRLQTDHVDVLFCPHGASGPDLEDEILQELFDEFKQKGMIRASAVSFHSDVAGNLQSAAELGYYDVAMFAYNIANHAAVDPVMYKAKRVGMGLVGMKLSRLFVMENQPDWIEEKLQATVPDHNISKFAKSYLWALQNPNLSMCVSQMETLEKMMDNLQVVGMKI